MTVCQICGSRPAQHIGHNEYYCRWHLCKRVYGKEEAIKKHGPEPTTTDRTDLGRYLTEGEEVSIDLDNGSTLCVSKCGNCANVFSRTFTKEKMVVVNSPDCTCHSRMFCKIVRKEELTERSK